jgi:hypothetical protein
MDLVDFIVQFNVNQILTFILVLSSVALLTISVSKTLKFYKILKTNKFHSNKWILVISLIFLFIIGYVIHTLNVFNFFEFPVSPILLVSLIYFFGAVFVLITMQSTFTMVKSILGDVVSNEKAIEIFLEKTQLTREELPYLENNFTVNCNSCKCNITYNVADVIRQHFNLSDKGVIVESTFGIKSIILRPHHKCDDGLREIIVIHDHTLAFRSKDQSKTILNTGL